MRYVGTRQTSLPQGSARERLVGRLFSRSSVLRHATAAYRCPSAALSCYHEHVLEEERENFLSSVERLLNLSFQYYTSMQNGGDFY